jgi:hypothetical protein
VLDIRHYARVGTPEATAMKGVVAQLQPLLRQHSFRKRGHSFNRGTEPGLVQVLNFQMGPFEPPGTVAIPGLRENLYGLFTVNLGVFVEEAWRLEDIRFGPEGAPTAKSFINEYDCQLRRRLPNLHAARPNEWWSLADVDVASTQVAQSFSAVGLSWLEDFSTRDAILTALESASPNSRAIADVGGPDRLLATRMRLGAGDLEGAQRNLTDWVQVCRSEVATKPHTAGHLEYLAEFAARNGLVIPEEPRA